MVLFGGIQLVIGHPIVDDEAVGFTDIFQETFAKGAGSDTGHPSVVGSDTGLVHDDLFCAVVCALFDCTGEEGDVCRGCHGALIRVLPGSYKLAVA